MSLICIYDHYNWLYNITVGRDNTRIFMLFTNIATFVNSLFIILYVNYLSYDSARYELGNT